MLDFIYASIRFFCVILASKLLEPIKKIQDLYATIIRQQNNIRER